MNEMTRKKTPSFYRTRLKGQNDPNFPSLAKASTANGELSSWSSALFSGSTSSFALKQHTQIQSILAHTLKVAILTSY